MMCSRALALSGTLVVASLAWSAAAAQSAPPAPPRTPPEYEAVLTALGKKGDYKDDVLKVNIPRSDLTVRIGDRPAPTPFGFGGWVAFTKASDGTDVAMGDLVLTEDEVNPVMSALLDNGLQVTALHNHFFWEQPRVFYMHVHGRGRAAELARDLKPAIDLIDRAAARRTPPPTASPSPPASPSPAASPSPSPTSTSMSTSTSPLDTAALGKIVGHEGEQSGPVYKITIGRPDIDLRDHGARINARMGLNTWAAFVGTNADAMVAGDVAMLEPELTPVLKALRSNHLDVVAIHHHMTDVTPMVVFLHYFGTGPAEQLARGVRAAVDQLGKAPASHAAASVPASPATSAATSVAAQSGSRRAADAGKVATPTTVLFMCPHGAGKSVLASAYFKRLAKERGLNVRVDAVGTEPDPVVGPKIAAHLQQQGYETPIAKPRAVTPDDLRAADVVVSLGCDLTGLPAPRGELQKWDDVPGPGEDFAGADEAIRRRVAALIEELVRAR